jgi:predicted nucleotidyltransferase
MADLDGLQWMIREAARVLDLRRVFLFGSRARGDARKDSDIDLAFEHGSSPAAWADFVNAMRDGAPTLLDLDLVDLAEVGPELRTRIVSEGKVLYG